MAADKVIILLFQVQTQFTMECPLEIRRNYWKNKFSSTINIVLLRL